jgi:hypothetical protein
MAALTEHEKSLVVNTVKGIAPVIHELEQQIHKLQARVAELEGSSLRYLGVYQPSAAYRRGDIVTLDGSGWHCTRAVSAERPGSTDAWQLMIKHGKDAANPRSNTATSHARENGHLAWPRAPI